MNNRTALQPGCKVCIFPGLRKHSPAVRISPGEVCTVAELPANGQPSDAVTIRRPSGEVVLIDADMVGRLDR